MPKTSAGELLADILAAPDDDAPRLVYADLLQSEGDPRGELIAVQCELARLGCERDERLFLEWVGDELADTAALDRGHVARLRARASTILKAHAPRWAKEIVPSAAFAAGARFWRGFQEHALWDQKSTIKGGLAGAMARAPIRSLMPTGLKSAKELTAFLNLPPLATIRELYNGPLSEHGLLPFTESPLPALRRLLLGHTGGAHELDVLPRAACLPRLTGLVLNGFSIEPSVLGPIVAKAAALEELQLVDTRLGATCFAAISKLAHLERLRVLGVRHGRLGPSEAAPFLESKKLEGLRALDLRTNRLGAPDTKIVGNAYPHLRVLNLGNNPLDKDAIAKLVGGGGLGALRVLSLEKSNVDDAMLAVIAKSPIAARLRSLDLRKNAITDAGVASLLRAKDLSALRTLYLGGNKLSAAGKKRLKESKALASARLFL